MIIAELETAWRAPRLAFRTERILEVLMQANLIAPSFAALAVTLLATGAGAQTVISRTITTEPVETTVTQTPGGTIVTRRPADRGIVQQPTLRAPVVAPAAPAAIASGPDTIDEITTRQVVERAAATRATRATSARQMTTRQVSARGDRAPARSVQRTVTRQTIRVRTPARLALSPRDRQIVYQTIVEQQVVPRPPAVVASPVLAEPALIQRQVALPAYRP